MPGSRAPAPAGLPQAHPASIRPTVAFRTLGCKLNQCETAQMEEALQARGYVVVPWEATAVSRGQHLHRDGEERPRPAGTRSAGPCGATPAAGSRSPAATPRSPRTRWPRSPGSHWFWATSTSPGWRSISMTCRPRRPPSVGSDPNAPATSQAPCTSVTPYDYGRTETERTAFEGDFFTHFSGYTRAFLKVQNGCDASCSYCVIPAARGPSRSMPADGGSRSDAPAGRPGVPRSGAHRHTRGLVGTRHRRGRSCRSPRGPCHQRRRCPLSPELHRTDGGRR